MSVNPQTGPSEYAENIQSSITAMQNMENSIMQKAADKLQTELGMLETLPTEVAYSFSVAVMGQATQLLGISQVGVPSEQLNTQNATLNMVTYIQSLWNDLSGSAQGYNSNNGSNPSSQQQADAGDLYASLQDLQLLCEASLNPSSSDYGWMNQNTASTMLNSVNTILNAITDSGQDTTGYAIANNILNWYGSYDSNPTSSTYSTEINNCTNSMNTMINTMNQTSSVTTGLLKTGASELQQFYGAVESSGQSQTQATNYFIQNEITN